MEIKTVGERGTLVSELVDGYGVVLTVQESSEVDESRIWLGVNSPPFKVLVPSRGWLRIPMEEVEGLVSPKVIASHIDSRVYLSQQEASKLITVLQHFVDHGTLPTE